jgi:proline dehydrogenase
VAKAVLIDLIRLVGMVVRVEPTDLAGGVRICSALAKAGIGTTIGKFSTVRDTSSDVVAAYCAASDSMRDAPNGAFYLSVKPPALDFELDHVVAVASRALSNAHGIHFDSHGYDLADPTLKLLDRLLACRQSSNVAFNLAPVSLSIPSRWKRSIADAEWAVERGVGVRLVKGEFRAARGSVELEPGKAFLELAEQLASRVPTLAIGTHDERLAREVLTRLRGTRPAVRLELLYGFPAAKMLALAREFGVPVAFYVAYGDALLAYGIRDLLTYPYKLSRGSYLDVFRSPSARLARTLRYWAPT